MIGLSSSEIDAVHRLAREALGLPDLSREELAGHQWTSHQTLDIIFAVEDMFAIQFSSEQMETIDCSDALLVAIQAARASTAPTPA